MYLRQYFSFPTPMNTLSRRAPSAFLLVLCLILQACNPTMQAYKNGVKKFENGEYDLALKDLQRAAEGNYELAQTN